MIFLRALHLDLKVGIQGLLPVFAGVAVVSLSCLVEGYTRIDWVGGVDVSLLSFADNAAVIFAGSTPYEFRPGLMFIPPLGWTFLLLLVLSLSISYPYRDLMGFGQQVLVRENSRAVWWFSKCAWVLMMCLMGCAVIFVTAALWTILHGQDFNLTLHDDALYLAESIIGPFAYEAIDGRWFLLGCICMLCALSLVQLLFALLIKPTYAFLLMVFTLVASAFAQSWALPGNYLMFVRWGGFIEGGLDALQGLSIGLAVSICAVVVGLAFFCRMDLVNKEMAV